MKEHNDVVAKSIEGYIKELFREVGYSFNMGRAIQKCYIDI